MKKDDDLGFDGIFDDIKDYIFHPTKVDRATFVALANAYIKDYDFLDALDNSQRELADKFNIETDFMGLAYFGGNLFPAVIDLLGDDFSYWYFDCEKDFDKFNKNIEYKDGSHPNVHSLEDLWEFSKGDKK